MPLTPEQRRALDPYKLAETAHPAHPSDAVEEVTAPVRWLQKIIGYTGRAGLRFNPILRPVLELKDIIIASAGEIVQTAAAFSVAAGNNDAGAVQVMHQVPDGEMWLVNEWTVSCGKLNADQAINSVLGIWAPTVPANNLPAGALGGQSSMSAGASQATCQTLIIQPFVLMLPPRWVLATYNFGAFVLGVAASITLHSSARIARFKV